MVLDNTVEYVPEVGDDLVTSVGDLLVLLGSALGDFEAVLGEDTVAGVRTASDLAAVDAVAEDLGPVSNSSAWTPGVPTLASLLPAAS
jgi:hypothetical protein